MFQREGDGRDIAAKWSDNGIDLMKSPIFNIIPKIDRVRQMQEDKMLFMQRHCKMNIKQHTEYQSVRNKRTHRLEPQARHDHTCEATRNAMSWLPINVDVKDLQERYKDLRSAVDKFMARAVLKSRGSSKIIKGTMRKPAKLRVPISMRNRRII